MSGPTLTHIDRTGAANMVDVSDKAATSRTAVAEGVVVMRPETLALIREATPRRAMSSARRVSPASWPPSGRMS